MIKGEIISQFEGFGNNIQENPLEYFRSSGFSKSANGITANKYLNDWFNSSLATKYPQYTTISTIGSWATGFGRNTGSLSGSDSMLYAIDNLGKLFGSVGGSATPELLHDVNKNASIISNGSTGIVVDQKKRLLIVGQRYLEKLDPSVSDVATNLTVTNGSDAITVNSNDANPDWVEKLFRIQNGTTFYYYRIKTRTMSNAVTIYGTVGMPSGTYSAVLCYSYTPTWKDFGTNKTTNSEGNAMYYPTETYEDTVLIGRGSNIVSLNTLTDTITDDSTPAFTLPTGFDVLAIHKGLNGILIGSNFQRKGVLVLWDNFSDRSIAPWIDLPDRLISVCKYSGGWIVITAREIFYTDGYSLTPYKKFFLDTDKTVLSSNTVPQSSFIEEDQLHFIGAYTASGKRRAGLYKMDITSKLLEFYPRENLDQYNTTLKSLFYDAGNGNGIVFAGTTTGIDYLLNDSEPPVATYISNPVGKGENWKYAEGLKLNLGVSPQNSEKQSPYSFKIIAKICPMEKQMFNVGVVKTTMADTTHVVVDETVYHIASEGDEIEFLDGESAGYSRNITSISGSGTATATYTLDRAVPTVVSANYHFFITPFRLIKVKTYTNVSVMPIVEYEIKNRPKGKKFLIKIEIEDANVPVEIRPSIFLYDDTGTI